MKIKIAVILFILSLYPALGGPERVLITLPPVIDLTQNDIVFDASLIRDPAFFFEVTVYSFSTGKITMSFNDSRTLKSREDRGVMKALVKIKKNNALTRARFIEITGRSREELLKKFADKLNDILGEY